LAASQFFLPPLAFVHTQHLEQIHDPGAHLHQPMAMPEKLQQTSRFSFLSNAGSPPKKSKFR
jgi:hypothetical protein